jgi:hypothetical protein
MIGRPSSVTASTCRRCGSTDAVMVARVPLTTPSRRLVA